MSLIDLEKLVIQPIREDYPEPPFDCGRKEIQDMIKEAYYMTLIKQGLGYNAYYDNVLIAQFMLRIVWIRDEDRATTYGKDVQTCLQIKYIAVDEKYQRKGIGTILLKMVVRLYMERCYNKLPIRFIVFQAVKDKVEWYSRRGFRSFPGNMIDPSADEFVEPMYMDFVDFDALDAYDAATICV